jgi:hypothetical protein
VDLDPSPFGVCTHTDAELIDQLTSRGLRWHRVDFRWADLAPGPDEIDWSPAVRYLQPEDDGVNRFAFVIHPLSVGFIHKHPLFGWTRYFPDRLVERAWAYLPPIHVSTIRGGKSPSTPCATWRSCSTRSRWIRSRPR